MVVPDGQEPNLDAIRARLESEETDGIVPAYFEDVPALLAALTQLQADLDAAENTSQMHERSWHLAEAALTQLQADLAEARKLSSEYEAYNRVNELKAEAAQLRADLAHVGLDATMGHTRATQLRAERDAAVEALRAVHRMTSPTFPHPDRFAAIEQTARAALAPAVPEGTQT